MIEDVAAGTLMGLEVRGRLLHLRVLYDVYEKDHDRFQGLCIEFVKEHLVFGAGG